VEAVLGFHVGFLDEAFLVKPFYFYQFGWASQETGEKILPNGALEIIRYVIRDIKIKREKLKEVIKSTGLRNNSP
jgi:hypothetical protein